jgi:D-alanyl-D-alanine carboxypeptidase
MADDALAVGVKLVLISGYRSLGHQRLLFFKGAEKRELSFEKRARTSAPPGYSEHHTGYSLDIDDGEDSRIFRQSFVETAAGQWLLENATSYCFELSFPAHGRQGLAYEPWHWRFVGTKHAAETFRAARMHDPADPAVSLDFSETTNEHRCTAAK